MTQVEFEVATLAEALREANAIAPTKGAEAEKYAGFYFEIRPAREGEDDAVFLRCTNGTIFYTKQVEVLKIVGIDQDWRIPSQQIASFAATIPAGAGKVITLERQVIEDATSPSGYRYTNRIIVRSGRAQATLRMIPPEGYINWEPFDPTDFPEIVGFGTKIDRVGWAVATEGDEILKGVFLDGTYAVATNRYRIAVAELPAEFIASDPITVPMSPLAPILRQVQDVKLGVVDGQLCISPNDYTQIKVSVLGGTFPDLSRVMASESEETIMLTRDSVVAAVSRVLSIGSDDRQLALFVVIGNGEILFYVQGDGHSELVQDAITLLAGQGDHDPITYSFGPSLFQDAFAKSPAQDVVFHYNLTDQKRVVKFATNMGYNVWVQPRQIGHG